MNKKNFLAQNWFRISSFMIGVVLLFWLPIEDASETSAFIISTAICSLFAASIFKKKYRRSKGNNPIQIMGHFVLAGLLAGLAVSPTAVFLMIFKNGLHGHGSPDFNNAQISAALQRAPFWTLSGLLIGIGSGVWQITANNITQN